jgi:hypothetical protein
VTIAIKEDEMSDYFDRNVYSYSGSHGISDVAILTNPYTKDVKILVRFGNQMDGTEERFFDDYDEAVNFHLAFVFGKGHEKN